MSFNRIIKIFLVSYFLLGTTNLFAQEYFSLQYCLDYAVKNNHSQKKMQYDKEKSEYAYREVMGGLLPQVSGSAGLNDNLKKAKFIMPNFINSMLPPSSRDPNADKYMTIEVGTQFNANFALGLNQQLLNFPLFNALNIAASGEKLAALGAESNEEDLIQQISSLFYSIQTTEYAVKQMEKSIDLVKELLKTMEINYQNGLVKKIDVDRLKVNLVNLSTQKSAIQNAVEVQKNLLKLQMGLDTAQPIEFEPINLVRLAERPKQDETTYFSLSTQIPYLLIQEKQNMIKLQKRSAAYEFLPVVSFVASYQYSGMSDMFFKGETNYWYSTFVVGINVSVPIFRGMSRLAKISQSNIELLKSYEDTAILEKSLKMAYVNAQMKLDDALKTIELQRDNQRLAEDVFNIQERNFNLGLSSMSDILNASQSLVQAQLSYANALNDYMKAWIEMKKASGNIRDLLSTD